MRDIKFRAWDGEKMYYEDFVGYSGGYGCFFNQFQSPVDLMQFIGLYDKNGKEIYESDVVKDEWGTTYQVVMEEGYFFGKYKDRDMDADINLYHKESTIEIIGNIHENPELLNNKSNDTNN